MKTNKVWLTLRFCGQKYSIEYWTHRPTDNGLRHHMRYREVDVQDYDFDDCAKKLKTGISKKYNL